MQFPSICTNLANWSLVHPILGYTCCVWDHCQRKHVLRIFGARCFTRSMALHTPNHCIQACGSCEIITSTTILRNVVENQLGQAGMSHPEDTKWDPMLRNSMMFSCHGQANRDSASELLSIEVWIQRFHLLVELLTNADEFLQPVGVLFELPTTRWVAPPGLTSPTRPE